MAIAIGVSSKGTTTGATSVATTGVATQAAGSCIVGAMVFEGTFSNYTDNKSNSPYVQVGSEQTVDTTNSAKLRMYHFPNAVGGAGHTTTAAVTTSQPITNMVAEITGAALSSVVGTSNGATDTTSPYGNLVTITPTAGNYLLLAAFGGNSGSNPATQAETQGFTILTSTQELNGATLWTGCLAYKLVTADGVTAYTAQFTESGASQGGIILAAFKELTATASMGAQRVQGPGYGPINKRARATRSFESAATGGAMLGAIVAGAEAAGLATGAGALSGASVVPAVTAARLGGALPATGAAIAEAVAAGNLGGTAVTQGAIAGVAQAAGQLQGAGQVTGAVIATTFTAGSVQATATLTGAIVAGVYAAGVLADAVSGNLFGALVAGATSAGQLAASAAASGATIAVTFTSGQLTASAALNGAAVVVAVVAGVLSGSSPGSMNAAASIAVSAAGALVSLTPAGPEETGGGLAGRLHRETRQEPDTRVMKFFDLQRPEVSASTEVSSEASVSAFLRSESVKSSAVNNRQREALALLLLMV